MSLTKNSILDTLKRYWTFLEFIIDDKIDEAKRSVALGEIDTVVGSTDETDGRPGLVPAPKAGDQSNKYLKADGTWAVPSDTDTTYNIATDSVSGLTKLYTNTGLNTDGTITQNALTTILDNKAGTSHTHAYLPLAGGTMTGDLLFQTPTERTCGFILTPADSSSPVYKTNLDIGWNYANRDGAGFYIRSVDFGGTTAGGFGAYARDASNSYDFYGLTSGLLQWAGPEFNIGGGHVGFKYDTTTGCLNITVS